MKLKCPYCGNDVGEKVSCSICNRKLEWANAFWHKSMVYYNAGYKAAKSRDLTLAEAYLRKAVLASKYAIEARNLLGLVYYETGRVGEALKEWIISASLEKENNIAAAYIKEVQENPKRLEQWNEAIRLYNQSLEYLKQKNIDMAIIRLKKAVSLNQKFVRARVMLGLCYMYDKQYYKANESIKKALMIDHGDKEALKYYYELSSEDTESCEPYQKTYHPELVKTKHISPNTILERKAILTRSVLYFVLGMIAAVITYTFLIIPPKLQSYKDQIKEMNEAEQALQDKMKELSTKYDEQVKELEGTKAKLESEVANYESQVGVLTQKERLASAEQLKNERNYIEAADKLYNIASTKLDEVDQETFKELKNEVFPRANEALYSEAINSYNKAEYTLAITHLEKILLFDPEEKMTRRTLYYLGCSEMENGNLDNAKKYFNQLVSEYKESYEAGQASRKLKDLTGL